MLKQQLYHPVTFFGKSNQKTPAAKNCVNYLTASGAHFPTPVAQGDRSNKGNDR